MLIQFSVRNYTAFKDKAVLSMIESDYEKGVHETTNVADIKPFGLKVLKTAVIYGANASGKTKLLSALGFMRYFVLNSSKNSQSGDPISVEPFKLSSSTKAKGSEFEAIFLYQKQLFRYGFEVDKNRVIAEWFYRKVPKKKEVELFYRDATAFEVNEKEFPKGLILLQGDMIRENALMLSVAAQFNESIAQTALEWFDKNLQSTSGLEDETSHHFSLSLMKHEAEKKKILEFVQAADFDVQSIELDSLENEENKGKRQKKSAKDTDAYLSHKQYDENNMPIGMVDFSLDHEESSGTKKFFSLSGPILHALQHGATLVIDELDSKLHPNLAARLITLFNSAEHNPQQAQLIFNTHNTTLLSAKTFRRDQVWFVKKNKYGASSLYSLADFKNIKKDEALETNYLKGKYGAIPFLSGFDNLFEEL